MIPNIRRDPLPTSCTQFRFEATFTRDEFLKLRQGVRPRDQDDKWATYFEAPWLYVQRASGRFFYGLQLEPTTDGGATVVDSWVNSEVVGWLHDEEQASLKALLDHFIKDAS